MEVFTEHAVSWLVLIIGLVALAYTAWVIKNEKTTYDEQAENYHLKHYRLPIPSWWGQVGGDNEHALVFERTDTRYDWRATFVWVPFDEQDQKDEQSLKEVFADLIREKEIVFDTDTSIVHNPSDFQQHPAVVSEHVQILRVEGTATQQEITRLYYDAVLVCDHEHQGYLFAESRSSVLNGLVEGPYFEEVMLNFERLES